MVNNNFSQLFSTPVLLQSHEDNQALNDTLIQTVRALENQQESSDRDRSHQGGFYTPGDLFEKDLPGISEVKALILDGIKEYVDQVVEQGHGRITKIPTDKITLQGWAAFTRKNHYQAPHLHAGANISGIYYLKVPKNPEPQGMIDLLNPLEVQEMTFIPGAATTHCRVAPHPGLLLIFPAYVRHTVHPFFSEDERIIIVFNAIIYKSYGLS